MHASHYRNLKNRNKENEQRLQTVSLQFHRPVCGYTFVLQHQQLPDNMELNRGLMSQPGLRLLATIVAPRCRLSEQW